MLSLFKNDNIITVIFLFLFGLLLRLPLTFGWAEVPLSLTIHGGLYEKLLFGLSDTPFLSAIIALILVCIQGVMLNRIAAKYKMQRDRTQVYGLLYLVFCSLIPSFWLVTPPLVALFFLLLSFNNIFALYKSITVEAHIFNAVFWLVVGSFFYPPVIWILLVLFIGMTLLHSVRLRDIFVFFSAIIVPVFVFGALSFLFNFSTAFWENMLAYRIQLPESFYFNFKDFPGNAQFGLGLVLLLWVLFSFGSYFSRKLIHLQKYITIFYWLLFFIALSFFMQREPTSEHFLLAAPAMGFFLGHSFQSIKNTWIGEAVFFALFLTGIVLNAL